MYEIFRDPDTNFPGNGKSKNSEFPVLQSLEETLPVSHGAVNVWTGSDKPLILMNNKSQIADV